MIREIILVTMNSLAQREFCEKDLLLGISHPAAEDQLEVACWNGLLHELLPEIMNDSRGEEKMYLWQVENRSSYLNLSLGSCNPEFEKEFTIDPSSFLNETEMN